MEHPALEKELKDRALLYDEIKMWLRLGFYIGTEPKKAFDRNGVFSDSLVLLIDGAGNKRDIDATMGKNIRMSVLSWWQVERVKPRAQEVVDSTGLSELENRNGN